MSDNETSSDRDETGDKHPPHWKDVLDEFWDRADRETFESIDVRAYCDEHGYSEQDVANVLKVMSTLNYIEWGVSPMYLWFHTEWDHD